METLPGEPDSAAVWPPAPRSIEGSGSEANDLPSMTLSIDTLPYALRGACLSRFRSGDAVVSARRLSLSGRMSPSRQRRARVYLLGGLGFVPGVLLAYLALERSSWGRQAFVIGSDNIISICCREDYRLVSVLYRVPEADNGSGRVADHSLTFQVDSKRYPELVAILAQHFPGKLESHRLHAALEPGAEFAWIGLTLWLFGILAAVLSRL